MDGYQYIVSSAVGARPHCVVWSGDPELVNKLEGGRGRWEIGKEGGRGRRELGKEGGRGRREVGREREENRQAVS